MNWIKIWARWICALGWVMISARSICTLSKFLYRINTYTGLNSEHSEYGLWLLIWAQLKCAPGADLRRVKKLFCQDLSSFNMCLGLWSVLDYYVHTSRSEEDKYVRQVQIWEGSKNDPVKICVVLIWAPDYDLYWINMNVGSICEHVKYAHWIQIWCRSKSYPIMI